MAKQLHRIFLGNFPSLNITTLAFIINIKKIDKGEFVGYNRKFIANKKTKIATVSFGYSDGYVRSLAFIGANLILKGKRVPYYGDLYGSNIC